MVSTFLGYGLAQAGKAIADTAGTAALQQQKADLENQKITLANQLAEGTETRLAGVTAGYASQAAEKLAQSQTGLETLRQTGPGGSLATAEIQSATSEHNTDVAAATSRQNTKDQIAAGALDIGIDANSGNTVILNKLTGQSTNPVGADGKPLQLTNPAVAQLARSVVISSNEQVRALTLQYSIAARNAQKQVSDALKAASGDQTDKDVIAAKAAAKAIDDQYNTTINNMNANVAEEVKAALHGQINAPTAASGSNPDLSKYLLPPSTQTPAGTSAPGIINAPGR